MKYNKEHVNVIKDDLKQGLAQILGKGYTPEDVNKANLVVHVNVAGHLRFVKMNSRANWKSADFTKPDYFSDDKAQNQTDIDEAISQIKQDLEIALENMQKQRKEAEKKAKEKEQRKHDKAWLAAHHIATPLDTLRALAYYCLTTGHKLEAKTIETSGDIWEPYTYRWSTNGNTIADWISSYKWPLQHPESLLQIKDFRQTMDKRVNNANKCYAESIKDPADFSSKMMSWGLFVDLDAKRKERIKDADIISVAKIDSNNVLAAFRKEK